MRPLKKCLNGSSFENLNDIEGGDSVIQVDNLSVSFGVNKVLNNLNIDFKDNKIYCILGRSGTGKTTLLRSIAGLLEPSDGKVAYEGKKITKPNENIFMMHQNYANFPWKNCMENVLFPIKLKRKATKEDYIEATKLLVKVGLGNHVEKYPEQLSGGQKQRLSLARVLMSKPKVILMDEPLSALDDKTREEMQDLIMKLQKETKNIIIMITHSKSDADKMADHIIQLG